MTLLDTLSEIAYPGVADHWDDAHFRSVLLKYAKPEWRVLELGAGSGRLDSMDLRAHVRVVHGVDPDRAVCRNRLVHRGTLGAAESLPFADRSFDLVFTNNVLEHLEDPERAFSEVARVLRPGGWFLAKTPSRLHYVALVASVTPLWFHRLWNRWRGRPAADTYPTRYRANTSTRIRRLAKRAGLRVERIDHLESRPNYLALNAILFAVGIIYERLVNSSRVFAPFRAVLVARLTTASPDGAMELRRL